jgi:dihydropteroate synthase
VIRPKLMGIVNLSTDSFSGDGVEGKNALTHAHALIQAGANILDVGAESTRPGANPLTAEEEWTRLCEFFHSFYACEWSNHIPVSVDTRHAQNAARVLDIGVNMINDVGGLHDLEMLRVLSGHPCDIVAMHSLTIPAEKAVVWPSMVDPVAEILAWKSQVIARAEANGVMRERLIFDAGLGFGKTQQQSLMLALAAQTLKNSGDRWLFGHSRKSFLTLFTNELAPARDSLTLAFSAMFTQAGIDYLRVHNVSAHRTLLDDLCM